MASFLKKGQNIPEVSCKTNVAFIYRLMYLLVHGIKYFLLGSIVKKKKLKATVLGGNKGRLKALKREKAVTYLRT